MEVHRELGCGFLERVYGNALAIELGSREIPFEKEARIAVSYKDQNVGDFFADFLVDGKLILELKATRGITEADELQAVNYLASTKIDDALILNFGKGSLEVKRKFRNYKPASNPFGRTKHSNPVVPEKS